MGFDFDDFDDFVDFDDFHFHFDSVYPRLILGYQEDRVDSRIFDYVLFCLLGLYIRFRIVRVGHLLHSSALHHKETLGVTCGWIHWNRRFPY